MLRQYVNENAQAQIEASDYNFTFYEQFFKCIYYFIAS